MELYALVCFTSFAKRQNCLSDCLADNAWEYLKASIVHIDRHVLTDLPNEKWLPNRLL